MEAIATATGLAAKCSLLYVLSAVRIPKCRSSLVKVDQCIVVSATTRPD